MNLKLVVNELVGFYYPAANYRGVRRRRMEFRRVLITAIRDLRDDPIRDDEEIEPNLNRGTMLVTGLDLDKNAERSFYVESMAELRRLHGDASHFRPLAMALTEGGEFLRIKELPDPRAAWVERYGQEYPGLGAA